MLLSAHHRLVIFLSTLPFSLIWLLMVLAGGALGFASALYGLWPLLFISLPLLALTLAHKGITSSVRRAFLVGQGFAFGYFCHVNVWLESSFVYFHDYPPGTGVLALLVLGATLSLFWGAATLISRYLWQSSKPTLSLFSLAGLLAGFDALRTFVPLTGFPFAMPAYMIMASAPLSQVLNLIGPYGVNSLIILLGLMPALLFLHFGKRTRLALLAGTLSVLGALYGYGSWRLTQALPGDVPIALRLVQPAIGQEDKMKADLILPNLIAYQHLLEETPWPDNPEIRQRLAFYPETAYFGFLSHDIDSSRLPFLSTGGANALLIGAFHAESPSGEGNDQPEQHFYNAVLALTPSPFALGSPQSLHLQNKVKLAPFGEYIPGFAYLKALGLPWLQNYFELSKARELSISHFIDIPPFLPVICLDIFYPNLIRTSASPDAEWLVVLTNDGWFLDSRGPTLMAREASARAIELGLPLIRATPNGYSMIINPYGQVVSALGLEQKGILDGLLPASLPPTPYRLYGETFAFLFEFALLGISIFLLVNKRQR